MSEQEQPVEAATPVEEPDQPPEVTLVHKGYLHVGDGAADADNHGIGDEDPDHFHAFCRMPNAYQRRDMRNRALAAKARMARRACDPDSDAFQVLEADMEALLRRDDREQIVTELLAQDALADLNAATEEVKEEEEFAHIDDDIRRLGEAEEGDERDELERHTKRYWEAVDKAVKDRQDPRRQDLESLASDELVRRLREERVETMSTDEFLHAWAEWQIYLCTYEPDRRTRKFTSIEELHEADEEVLTAIRGFFEELERGVPKGSG